MALCSLRWMSFVIFVFQTHPCRIAVATTSVRAPARRRLPLSTAMLRAISASPRLCVSHNVPATRDDIRKVHRSGSELLAYSRFVSSGDPPTHSRTRSLRVTGFLIPLALPLRRPIPPRLEEAPETAEETTGGGEAVLGERGVGGQQQGRPIEELAFWRLGWLLIIWVGVAEHGSAFIPSSPTSPPDHAPGVRESLRPGAFGAPRGSCRG